MASCVRNIRTKNCSNLIILLQVTTDNVGDVCFPRQRVCTDRTVHALCIGRGEHDHLDGVDDDDDDDEYIEWAGHRQLVHRIVQWTSDLHRRTLGVLRTNRRQL